VQGTSRRTDSVKEAPLRPQKWWKVSLLVANRAARCVLVSAVPLVGCFLALPKMQLLSRSAPLCLKTAWRPGEEWWRPCGRGPDPNATSGETAAFLLAAWVSVQFLWNFVASCFCAPGSPQPPWPEAGRYPVTWEGPQLYYLPRWCDSCQQWKPPRAHHSKRLGQCVLRMDHYCVITENIIGQRNHGYFVLMVIFGNVGLLYALIFVAKTVHLAWQPYWALYGKFATYARQRGSYYQWLLMGGHLHVLKALLGYEVPLLLVLTVFSLILLGPLLRHVGLALRGTTVLEDMGHGDAIDLPGTKVLPLRPGDFRQPFWVTLQTLLGSRWAWRLLQPGQRRS
ncbi:PFA4, partial [Symbiodinium sp. CCMP2592]